MKDQIISDSLKAITDQAGLDDRFNKDFAAILSRVYDAGKAESQTVINCAQLTPVELAGIRSALLALVNK